tara:strand:+ start:504 stop:1427 length:924 start_codon:yes stop_codon:yes gene_type:complete
MFLTNLRRIAQAGFHGFWRNGFVSLASVLVMTITLLVIGSTIFSSAVFDATLKTIENKVDVNVYFVPEASEESILSMKSDIEGLPEVASVTYVSREQALEDLVERRRDDQVVLQALEEVGENPLGAKLNVRAKEPSQYQGVADYLGTRTEMLNGTPLIDNINFAKNKEAIDRLSQVIDTAQHVSVFLTIMLVVISVLITFNTIRLGIYVSREEISVMRLVGAGVMYIRGPFVFTGIMYGVVAGILSMIIFYPVAYYLGDLTEHIFVSINVFEYYISNFGQLFVIVVGSGIIIGAVSSYLAVKRYLKS